MFYVDPACALQTLVVIGETGSGKTTQMTQYLAEVGAGVLPTPTCLLLLFLLLCNKKLQFK